MDLAGYDLLGQPAQETGGDGDLGRGGFRHSSRHYRPTIIERLDVNEDDSVGAAEAESVDLRMAGWSFGGTQAINAAYDLGREGIYMAGRRIDYPVPVQRLVTWDPVRALYAGPLVLVPMKVLRGHVTTNIKTFRNFWQFRHGNALFRRIEDGQAVERNSKVGNWFTNFFHGEAIDTDYAPGSPQVWQPRVDQELANDVQRRDRVFAFGTRNATDPNPLWQPGEPLWEILGRHVNHGGIAAHAYERTLRELGDI